VTVKGRRRAAGSHRKIPSDCWPDPASHHSGKVLLRKWNRQNGPPTDATFAAKNEMTGDAKAKGVWRVSPVMETVWTRHRSVGRIARQQARQVQSKFMSPARVRQINGGHTRADGNSGRGELHVARLQTTIMMAGKCCLIRPADQRPRRHLPSC